MRVILDIPQPLEKLRKVYNDRVTFLTTTKDYPLITEIEIPGNYLGGMRKRLVPVRVGKKVDKLIARYTKRLERIWNKYQKEILSNLTLDGLKKLAPEGEVEKEDAPTLAQVLSETDPTRRQVLHIKYLKARKEKLIKPKIDEMARALKQSAKPMFESAYKLGKERGQILTNQELDDTLTDDDEELLEEKEDWNEEFLLALVGDSYTDYEKALDQEYESEEELLAALGAAHQKQQHRLPRFAAALGAGLLAVGMSQSIREIQEVDEDGEPTGEVKTDPETEEPLGDVFEGGYWHTNHDDRVCDGCENNDGAWMTLEDFQEEANTNDCLSNCRCIELFEPAPMPTDQGEVWTGSPGIDKGVRTFDLIKHSPHGISKHTPGGHDHDQSTHSPTGQGGSSDKDEQDLSSLVGQIREHGKLLSTGEALGLGPRGDVSLDRKSRQAVSEIRFILEERPELREKLPPQVKDLVDGKYYPGIFEELRGVKKHLAGQHDQQDHSPTGAPAKEPEAKAPPATAEARTTEATVGQRWLSGEDWGKEFKDAVEKEINLASEHIELVPKLDENTLADKVGTFARNAYETGSKHADTFIPITENNLAEARRQLAGAKERIAHGESTLVNVDYLETTKIPDLERRLKDYQEEKVHYAGTEIRDRLMDEVNLSVTALTAATSLEEQKAVARKLEGDLYKNKEELYENPNRNPVDYEVAKLHHAAVYNMRTEIEKMDTETLKGYMATHQQSIRDQWQSLSSAERAEAISAYTGGRVTPTVQQNKAFHEGKAWIEQNVSPHLTTGVSPVTWMALRGQGRRAHYLPNKETIEISNGWRETPDTIPHEFTHHIEKKVPGINEFFVEYYNRRTGEERAIPLSKFGSGYKPYEHTKPDKFAHHYMGHINLSRGRYHVRPEDERPGGEILSQAVGMFSQNRTAIELYRKDPEAFGITAAILKGWRPSKVKT